MDVTVEALDIKKLEKEFDKYLEDFHSTLKIAVKKASLFVEAHAELNARANNWQSPVTFGKSQGYFEAVETKKSQNSKTYTGWFVRTIKQDMKYSPPEKHKSKYYKDMGDRYYIKFQELGAKLKAKNGKRYTINKNPALSKAMEKSGAKIKEIIYNTLKKESKKYVNGL